MIKLSIIKETITQQKHTFFVFPSSDGMKKYYNVIYNIFMFESIESIV